MNTGTFSAVAVALSLVMLTPQAFAQEKELFQSQEAKQADQKPTEQNKISQGQPQQSQSGQPAVLWPPNKAMDGTTPVALPPEKSDVLPPEIQKIRDAIAVKWFQPQGFPDKTTKIVRVALAGQAKQGTRMYLKTNEIQILKSATERETRKLAPNEVKFLPSLADQRGIFAFELYLPVGNYQIAVAAVDPEAQAMSAAKVYILFLNVTLKSVEFGFIEEGEDKPFVPQSDYYSFGAGFNYSVFNKEVPSIPSEVRFSSFKFPTLRLGYAKTWNPEWRIHASLVASPGETKSGTRIPVEGGTYLWTILNAEGIYSKDEWKKEWRDYKLRYGIRGGVQYHNVPFVYSLSDKDSTQGILAVTYIAPSIGAHLDVMTDSEMSYEVYLKMNIPFVGTSSINMSESMAVDGSLGARYRKKKDKWSYGVYWYGQWLRYKFNENDAFTKTNVNGTFDILNSNLEFRVNYHF